MTNWKIVYLTLMLCCLVLEPITADVVSFTPPEGWREPQEGQLSSRVKMMVVGPNLKGFPPNLNLATEEYKDTLASYLKIVKSINQGKGNTWKNLGSITTAAGVGNLSQVDSKSQWGNLRMMHVILLKEGVIYILTATALAEEFPALYNTFFKSFRSLTVSQAEQARESRPEPVKKTIAEKDVDVQ